MVVVRCERSPTQIPSLTPLWTFCRGGDDTISAARSTSATGLAVAPRLREASARLNETDALLAAAVVAAETAGAGPGVGQGAAAARRPPRRSSAQAADVERGAQTAGCASLPRHVSPG